MKKIYIGISAALVAFSANAQTSKSIVAKEAMNDFKITTKKITPLQGTHKAGGGIILWSDDLSNAANWDIDNDGQSGVDFGWSLTSTDNSWAGIGNINSTSGGSYAQMNNGDPTANPATQALDVTYTLTTANAIDLTALSSTNVSLQYQQNGARFNDAQEVYISVNGGSTWTLVDDNSDKDVLSASGGAPYTNATTENINIGSDLVGADSLMIRFSWTTAFPSSATNPNVWVTYGWNIDDVALVTNDDNNLTMDAAYMGQGVLQLPYYLLVPKQIADISFSSSVTNNGAAAQPNTRLEVTADGSVYSSTPINLASLATDSLVTTNYTPSSANGTYAISYDLLSDSVDFDPTDNTDSKSIIMNSNFYGRDIATLTGSGTTGSISNFSSNSGQTFKIGNVFEMMAQDTMCSVELKLAGTVPTGGALVYAEVYKYDAGANDYIFLESSEELDVQTAAQIANMQTLYLNSPVALEAGDDILVVVGHYGSDIAFASAGATQQGSVLGYDAANSLASLIDPDAVVVRMNLGPVCGISVEEFEATGIKLLQNVPNPANNATNISYELANSQEVILTITDMTGKVIEVINEGVVNAGLNTTTLNVANYNSGVYFYSITAGGNTVTQKMTVSK